MRRILLAAVLVAVAAPASAETVIWTGEVHVEKWVTDDGSEFYGYWRGIFGNMPGVRQFEFDGRTYTVDLFYITNTPRSLLAGAERRGSPGILPTDRGLAWLVDGQRAQPTSRSGARGRIPTWAGAPDSPEPGPRLAGSPVPARAAW